MAKQEDILSIALRPERLPKAALDSAGSAPTMKVKGKAASGGRVSFQLAEPFATRASVQFHVPRHIGESDEDAVRRGLEEFVGYFLSIHGVILRRDQAKGRRLNEH